MKELLSGNEAYARGAYEAGVKVATGYPGTPSTEILEAAVKYKSDIYCEWSPNEKVAFEVAIGASLSGARVITTMKHVGLNVAADPLMTLAYTSVVGGFAILVADDPGMHSSQNEQDNRWFARFAKIPLFEPADSEEARTFLVKALEISELFTTPVMVRSTTRVSHSRSLVELNDRVVPDREIEFKSDPARFIPIPAWGRVMRLKLEERLALLRNAAEESDLNRIEWADHSLGIITQGGAYQYVKEVFPEASVLKLGWSWPIPEKIIRMFADKVERLLIVEELEDFTEILVKSLGIPCKGKKFIPNIGELNPDVLKESRGKLEDAGWLKRNSSHPVLSCVADPTLPGRPPVLCPGCPHRGVFQALKKLDVVVTGDIGCYSLGALPPLGRMDTTVCMGAGVSMAHGMQKSGQKRKVVGVVGDSTFFHSGITGLLDIVWNGGTSTILVLDNRTTGMTGHQDNPGTGKTLMGNSSPEASIEEIGRACGFKNVMTVNPLNLEEMDRVLHTAVESDEPWLIVAKSPCVLAKKLRQGPVRHVNTDKCRGCKMCLKLGCPGLECAGTDKPSVNALLCNGCGLCSQVCPFAAIEF